LVLGIVIGSAALQLALIHGLHQRNTEATQQRNRRGLEQLGRATVETAAVATLPYFQLANDDDLRQYIAGLPRQVPDVTLAFAVDDAGRLIAHSSPGRSPRSGHVDFTDPAWLAVRSVLPGAGNEPVVVQLPEGEGLALFAKRVVTRGGATELFHGHVVVGYSLRPVRDALLALQRDKESAIDTMVRNTGLFGALFLGAGVALSIFLGLRTSRPIARLAAQARSIAAGDLDSRVSIRSSRELTQLAEDFNFMADRISSLLDEARERARLEKELDVAREIQFKLVPAELAEHPPLSLAACFEPAARCGGDWWTFYELPDGKFILVVADVTGHGVPSTMIAAAAKSASDTIVREHRVPTCEQLAQRMNDAVYAAASGALLMTAVVVIVDTLAGRIEWLNAGHNFPLLHRHGGALQWLIGSGNPMGLGWELRCTVQSEPLAQGDTLVLFTDGVIEAEDPAGKQFGERGVRKLFATQNGSSVVAVRDALRERLRSFTGGAPWADDVTFVVARHG
jgi:serine phosphatase RsbU (regulator of sigma subunit)